VTTDWNFTFFIPVLGVFGRSKCREGNKWPDRKNFLAMSIQSDMKAGGESQGTISRNYEGVGNPSVYPYFERLFRPALRGHGLSFQRISSKRAADSQQPSAQRRHNHDSGWDV
jgi:hypothetical protein